MKLLTVVPPALVLFLLTSCRSTHQAETATALTSTANSAPAPSIDRAQVPAWAASDLDFFLHGSMSSEFVPERVLIAFMNIYPDLFPPGGLTNFGLLSDPAFGWPVGVSRGQPLHLAELPSLGLNCAACHVGDVAGGEPRKAVRVLGMTSQFDAEAFLGAVIAATFRTADPANMKRFLQRFLREVEPQADRALAAHFERQWEQEKSAVTAVLAADPFGARDVAPGEFHKLSRDDFSRSPEAIASGLDLAALAGAMTKLFHNIRAGLHIPDEPPSKVPPASGPSRNDAFGLLSAVFFGAPQPYAPVKYGLVWNLEKRRWVHWDGNTQSPIGRNLLASLGLGAPLMGKRAQIDLALLQRHTDLSEKIVAPRYPFEIDAALVRRGQPHYRAKCASCHEGRESEARLYDVAEVGTEPQRAQLFTQAQADRFNTFLAQLEIEGYQPASEPGIRGTGKYWAPSMAGVWARSPYLHNGSVRTMLELLTPPGDRAKTFRRGSIKYDTPAMGYTDEGRFVLDTSAPGNSNAGHNYGTDLTAVEKRELIEYLKTL